MTELYQFVSVCIMAGLFLVVVLTVALITIKWPAHLYREISEEFKATRDIKEFINSPGFRDSIEDILLARVKPDCLQEADSERSE